MGATVSAFVAEEVLVVEGVEAVPGQEVADEVDGHCLVDVGGEEVVVTGHGAGSGGGGGDGGLFEGTLDGG